ncbi:hypothetical protein P9314_25175 [Paenibacillus validus]|uniref:SRPBCC family protein n=1 Tax=Paenibacillus TaxID=44249 RepID=UPI000FD704DF|nr:MULTISPECIES: SRPBCC family protein [Paenibacillus]MED4603924.1 hypothetical protein [Paenibacillus validus]MED4609425.1 hypothetical protein [Paenibacillus validus]
MTSVQKTKTISVTVDRGPGEVYEFIANPEHLPQWAPGFCRSVRRAEEEWIAETPDGPMTIRFVPGNEFGVLDHYVSPAPGQLILNPMRVIPNGPGCEVLFTVFQQPGMSDEQFTTDIRLVENDLQTLKGVLERLL